MSFDELLRNPFTYRCGNAYRGLNRVFPVEYGGKKYVVKMASAFGTFANLVCGIEDHMLFRKRRVVSSKNRIWNEAWTLEQLAGNHAPRIYAYDKKILVKEHIDGHHIKELGFPQQYLTLEGAFNAMEEFHGRGITIGDPHVKNCMWSTKGTYWVDFDTLYDVKKEDAKVFDLFRFIYSTYAVTKDEELTRSAARFVKRYKDSKIRSSLNELIFDRWRPWLLWISTQMPRDGKLNLDIIKILN